MKNRALILAVLGAWGLAACGESDSTATETDTPTAAAGANTSMQAGPAAAPAGDTYSGDGDITEISGDKVTISHGPIEGIGWPAMTMGFSVASPDVLQGLSVGDPVQFQFQKAGSDYIISSIKKK